MGKSQIKSRSKITNHLTKKRFKSFCQITDQISWNEIKSKSIERKSQIKSRCQLNDNSSRLYSLCVKCHQCTSRLTVNVSTKIRDVTITEINSLTQLQWKHQQVVIIPWPKLLKVVICSNHQIKSPKMKSNPNQITCFQIKFFVLRSNHCQWFNHDLNQIMIWICPSLISDSSDSEECQCSSFLSRNDFCVGSGSHRIYHSYFYGMT